EIERDPSDSTRTASDPILLDQVVHRQEVAISSDGNRPLLNERYVLLEELGRGGMSVVYLSWDLVLRRIVAIKVLRPGIADTQTLKREAAAAFELTHDNIVRMYHFEPGKQEKRGYLVMEYVPWPSGEKWIADAGLNGLPVRPVVEVGTHIC